MLRKILLLDDESEFRHIFHLIIDGKDGMKSVEVSTCEEALELCGKEKFDVVFLDHNIYNKIGWEIAEEIRKKPHVYGSPKIIAISGSCHLNSESLRQKYMDSFLEKPIDADDLINAINTVLDKKDN